MSEDAIVLVVINAILVAVTGYYAWQTRKTVKEMAKAREAAVFPKLLLEVTTVGAGYPMPRVRNVGVGTALGVEVTFSQTRNGATESREWAWHSLAPGEYKQFFLKSGKSEMMRGHQAIDENVSVSLTARYMNILGRPHEYSETVNVAEFMTIQFSADGVRGIGPQDDLLRKADEIRDALKEIAKRG